MWGAGSRGLGDVYKRQHIDKSCIGADYAVRRRVRAMMHLSYAFRQVQRQKSKTKVR